MWTTCSGRRSRWQTPAPEWRLSHTVWTTRSPACNEICTAPLRAVTSPGQTWLTSVDSTIHLIITARLHINYTLVYNTGCDHIGHIHIGHSKTISVTAKKPYRPHGKSISATTMSAKTISATRYRPQNIRRVYLVSSWRYVSVSCSPYGEFERERNITSVYNEYA